MTRLERGSRKDILTGNEYYVVGGYGEVSAMGKRLEMEDAHTIIPSFRGRPNEFFAGVYDGHAGRTTADYVAACLHVNFSNLLNYKDPVSAFKLAYQSTDDQVNKLGLRDGTTAVTAYIKDKTLFVANAGDSRAVLVKEKGKRRLSHDHKPDEAEEMERIQSLGGYIENWDIPRVNGILAMSRAIGDHRKELDGFITADPFISTTQLTEKDKFLVLACDGIWDVISDTKAAEIVRKIGSPQKAARFLKDEAITRRGSSDNVTAIVVELNV